MLFTGLGTLFIKGKGADLIAGYNTMAEEEKATYDTIGLCKFMGKMMFALSFSMVFWIMSDILNTPWLLYFGLVLFVGIIVFMIIFTNTGERFRNKSPS
nr:DUF3784 domain-containing protein [Sporosarcina aquimarina]